MTRRQMDGAERRLTTETRYSGNVRELVAAALEVPTLTVLAHPDPRRVGELSALTELVAGNPMDLSRRTPLFAAAGSTVSRPVVPRPLDNAYLSRQPLRLVPGSGGGEIILERAGSQTPAAVDGEPLDESRRFTTADLSRGVTIELGNRVVVMLHLHPSVSPELPRFGLVGDSGPMIRLRQEIQLAAGLDAAVLLRGASGTGKELVARAVHDASARRAGPWVTVNMAAIPPSLATAELFGARKGAYTGADREKKGFFLAASGGTLFLDEIGDTPPEVQPLLLRALESGEIQPVGSAETRRADVRLVAATDADLEAQVTDGRFRAPLLHRLAGFEIRLPALAERRADVGRLLVYFLERELEKLGEDGLAQARDDEGRPWPPAALVARLARFDWPGNVRQLANVARRLAISRRAGDTLALEPFVESLLRLDNDGRPSPAGPESVAGPSTSAPPSSVVETSPTGRWRPVYRKASEVDEEELVETLRAHSFELKPAAEALGVSRAVLYQLIEGCPRLRKAADLTSREVEEAIARSEGDLEAVARQLEVSLQGLKMRMKTLKLR